ncbi:hypothetical protein ACSQ67_024168 [Phaseolus vulgaris]
MNDKFNIPVDHIWNIPRNTDTNDNFVVSIKKGIICALYNFCSADNMGTPILTKASPSGTGYAFFTLLTGPHKGIFTNFGDLCIAKEGIDNPRYKGFYSREEAEKSLELDTINLRVIKEALEPEPEAKIDSEIYKEVCFEDLTISIKTLLDYGVLDTILICPTERFEKFHPGINEAINHLQATTMSNLAIEIVSCPGDLIQTNSYSTHVMKLCFEESLRYPILNHDGYETWDVKGNTNYQYSLLRAQVMGNNWFFTEQNEKDYNLVKETIDTKLYIPSYNGKMFFPFPTESNNNLVQHFQREKRIKEIYEASGCHGQQTPTIDLTMSETSESPEGLEDLEGAILTRR